MKIAILSSVVLVACASAARATTPAPEISPNLAASGAVLLLGAMVLVFGRRAPR